MNHLYDSSQMSIKRNLDETSIVNYKSNRQFLYAIRKNRIQRTKEPIMALCKLQAIFSTTTVLQSEAEKNAGIFVPDKARRSRVPEAYSRTLRTRGEDATQYGAKRPSFFGEFDPGSGRTLAACLTHASRTGTFISVKVRVANG